MKDPWLDTWRQHRLPLETRLVEPLAPGEGDDLQGDDWFRGSDEDPPEDHPPEIAVEEMTGHRLVSARLVGRAAVSRALEHLRWAWDAGAVVSFSIECAPGGTRISIVYGPSDR